MKKSNVLFLVFFLISFPMFSATNDSTKFFSKRNQFELSVGNMNNLIGDNSSEFLSVFYKRKINSFSLRLGGFSNSQNKTRNEGYENFQYDTSYTAFNKVKLVEIYGIRIGLEKDNYLFHDIVWYYGCDLIAAYQEETTSKYTEFRNEKNELFYSAHFEPNPTKENGYNVGVIPLIGITTYHTSRFSSSLEANLPFLYSKIGSFSNLDIQPVLKISANLSF